MSMQAPLSGLSRLNPVEPATGKRSIRPLEDEFFSRGLTL
ncbi:hypothetical protein HMPREF0281_02518 [Corynebacterium ammoniagenes DSM 20306]|uniref:Uncharacterized protein n=1 Tax=Corynebacterium ammoniagenes DSM 20306 TaxID=649754 RepID=A0ABP2IGI6_CORAM|nr:hypothetical protein HMPREF0281_02518 [Corynebacterium ammoniagenes DSM 20306]